jgi:hypothetical protein
MIYSETKYYFSIKSLTFATIFIAGITTLVLSVSIKLYQESVLWSILFATPLLIVLIAFPDYLRFMYCAIIRKPALELTTEFLINNAKGQTYKWTEIKEISYRQFKGFRSPPGGYIEISFKDSEKKIRLPNNSIKCKTKDLLLDLKEYLKSNERNST